MHSATTPPLIAYEANYKRRSGSSCAYTHRKQRFTDKEYNQAVEYMTSTEDAPLYPNKAFRINTSSSYEFKLKNLLKKILKNKPAYFDTTGRGIIVPHFDDEDIRDAAKKEVDEMIKYGSITHYHPENPLYAYTGDINDWSHRVKGITESLNYGKTTYVNEDGTKTRTSKEEEEDLENEEEEKKKKIILIAIVVVAIAVLLVLAILKKKGKI